MGKEKTNKVYDVYRAIITILPYGQIESTKLVTNARIMNFEKMTSEMQIVIDDACEKFKKLADYAEEQKKSALYNFILNKSKGFFNIRAKLLLIRINNKIKKIKKMVEKEIENLKK